MTDKQTSAEITQEIDRQRAKKALEKIPELVTSLVAQNKTFTHDQIEYLELVHNVLDYIRKGNNPRSPMSNFILSRITIR